MGTNYYIRGTGIHIGKRSAAGPYCWDCGITLCKEGKEGVHFTGKKWHKACPKCGKKAQEEDLGESSAGRELGFNKSKPKKKTGVASCSSFSWAIDPDGLYIYQSEKACSHCGRDYEDPAKVIENEYHEFFTHEEFRSILLECPIQYYHSIGKEFS